jgi:lysozyme
MTPKTSIDENPESQVSPSASAQRERATKISQVGKDLIKNYEKLRNFAYKPTPNDVLTVGWGHTGKDVRPNMVITKEEAEELFNYDCLAVESVINKAISKDLNQNQFDALACLIFNIGVAAFLRSHLREEINSSFASYKSWITWDHQGLLELAGLKSRREKEWELFNT